MDSSSSHFHQASVYNQVSKTVQLQGAIKLLRKVSTREGDRILDIGCGTGLMAKEIASMIGPSGYITGVDPDAERLKVARSLLQDYKNIEFIESRSNDFPFQEDQPYDIVVSNFAYHWVPNVEKIESFARVFKALKPGGTFIASMTRGRIRNIQILVDEYCKKHPEFYTTYENARSCIFYVTSEWLKDELMKLGFSTVIVEQADEALGVPTLEDFMDMCHSSSANTLLGNINYRSMLEEVKEVNFHRLPNGQVEVMIPTYYFTAKKLMHIECGRKHM